MDKARHLIVHTATVHDALLKLNELGADAILFVVDEQQKMLGSLTDGDLRRGFIRGLSFDAALTEFIQSDPAYVEEGNIKPEDIERFRQRLLKIIPVIDGQRIITDILNLRLTYAILPVEAVIMAGGRGQRLMPLTKDVPKPMLLVGDKPIIEHNLDRLKKFGISTVHISVNYLADVIRKYFKDGHEHEMTISYVEETEPLGTVGSVKLVPHFSQEHILIMNSDLLTDIDFADFFETSRQSGADMAVAATGYHVDVPYAVLEIDEENRVSSLKEKPRYTYYSNAGIYLLKKELVDLIPDQTFYNITDLMEQLLTIPGKKLVTYPIVGYWLDIGKHEDFKKAQEDIKHIKL